MRLRVLGCYGALTPTHRSTGFLLDDHFLLDGGTINSGLKMEEMESVTTLLLSHVHLDHIKEIPFFLQSRMALGRPSLVLAGIPPVLDALRAHIFNGRIWPDFSRIGDPPSLFYRTLKPETWEDFGDYRVKAVPVTHRGPCTGFLIRRGKAGFAYSADTHTTDRIWEEISAEKSVGTLCVEATFPDGMEDFAAITGHFTPRLLAADLEKIGRKLRLLITHMRPQDLTAIEKNFQGIGLKVELLEQGKIYDL